MISTHTLALEQEANIMSLPERVHYLADLYIDNLIAHTNLIANIYIQQYISKYSSGPYLFTKYGQVARDNRIVSTEKPLQYLIHFEPMVKQPDMVLLSCEKRGRHCVKGKYEWLIESRYSQHTRIFTDVSKTMYKTSCTFWIPNLNIEASFSLDHRCPIFPDEAYAIRESLLSFKTSFLIVGQFCHQLETLKEENCILSFWR